MITRASRPVGADKVGYQKTRIRSRILTPLYRGDITPGIYYDDRLRGPSWRCAYKGLTARPLKRCQKERRMSSNHYFSTDIHIRYHFQPLVHQKVPYIQGVQHCTGFLTNPSSWHTNTPTAAARSMGNVKKTWQITKQKKYTP